uniref:Uncharacterized protein n=1 Tax=Capra hircus TaxID=9925 RepID=A0A8C2NBB0_CAPHI
MAGPRGDRPKILHRTILDVFVQTPENVAYRKYTKQITNEKLGMGKVKPDIKRKKLRATSGWPTNLERKMMQWKGNMFRLDIILCNFTKTDRQKWYSISFLLCVFTLVL